MSLLFSPDRPLARSLAGGGMALAARQYAAPSPGSTPADCPVSSEEAVPWCGRAAAVRDAIRATLTDEPFDLATIFCDDVVGCTPTRTIHSRAQLAIACRAGDDALQALEVRIDGIDLIANKAIAEWQVTARFGRPFMLGDDRLVEPTGCAVELPGLTTAEFCGDRIRAFRHYLDDASLLEQVLSLG